MAEAELEEDLYRTFKLFFRANDEVRGTGWKGRRKLGSKEGELQRCTGLWMGLPQRMGWGLEPGNEQAGRLPFGFCSQGEWDPLLVTLMGEGHVLTATHQ